MALLLCVHQRRTKTLGTAQWAAQTLTLPEPNRLPHQITSVYSGFRILLGLA